MNFYLIEARSKRLFASVTYEAFFVKARTFHFYVTRVCNLFSTSSTEGRVFFGVAIEAEDLWNEILSCGKELEDRRYFVEFCILSFG
jgi:hypothetical protein